MWKAVMGFWETILDPLSHLVTESLELHFSSQGEEEQDGLHQGMCRLSEQNGACSSINQSHPHGDPDNLAVCVHFVLIQVRTHAQSLLTTSQMALKILCSVEKEPPVLAFSHQSRL